MVIITGDQTSGADFDCNVGDVIMFKLMGSINAMFKRKSQLENEHFLDIFPKKMTRSGIKLVGDHSVGIVVP